jgi:ABC-type multidrug transport system fused ATPase/permease subunit
MDVFGQTTVRKADSIIVLNRGEIVERGTWQAWVSRPDSFFAGMVKAGASHEITKAE